MMMNNVMGAKTQEELQQEQFLREQENYMQQQTEQRLFNNNMMDVLQPIDFNDKIMGGNNFDNFMRGKMPVMDNGNDYARRVNILMGNKMQEKQITDNKINAIIGKEQHNDYVMGQSEPIMNKMSAYFDTGNKEHLNFMLGNSTNKDWGNMKMDMLMSNKPLKIPMLNTNTKKMGTMNNSKMGTMNNSNIMPKFSMPKMDNMSKMFGIGNSKMPSNPFSNEKQKSVNKFFKNNLKMNVNLPFMSVKNPAKDITKMFGVFGNPEKHARKRIAQQTGLPMFGDYDRDKALNLVDCDPFDPNRQGGMHKMRQWIYGDRYSKNNTQYSEGMYDVNEVFKESENDLGIDSVGIDNTEYTYNDDGRMKGDDWVNGVRTGNYGSTERIVPLTENVQPKETQLNSLTELYKQREEVLQEISNLRDSLQDAKSGEKEGIRKLIQSLEKRLNILNKVIADTERYEQMKLDKMQQSDVTKYTKDRELKFAREKLAADTKLLERDKALQEKRFGLEKTKLDKSFFDRSRELETQKEIREEDRKFQREKFQADIGLKRDKLKAEQQKGDIAYMQSKLSAGKSLMDGLLGGSGQTNLGAVIGQSSGMGIVEAVKTQSGGTPFGYRVAESVGEQGSMPFSYKVQTSIQESSKPYSETVRQTLGLPKPKEEFEEPTQEPIEQPRYVEPQITQPQVAQPRYVEKRMSPPSTGYAPQVAQQQYRSQYQQPMYQQPQMGMPRYRDPSELNIDWNEVDPEQVAQIDPEYAEYLKKTDKPYRRGPYKTRD